MKTAKRFLATLLALCLVLGFAVPISVRAASAHTLVLNSTQNSDGSYSHTAIYDGTAVNEYDYTWHADPSTVHSDVKNSPAEYYTGTEPGSDDVYIAHDIYYYPELPTSGFTRQNYDGEQEWCYYYTASGYTSYIFSTLPGRSSLPTNMMHSAEEAYQNAVLHITRPGDYIIQGDWHGQIWVDLENYCDDPFTDPTAKVNLILNGVTINCSVAAGVVFHNVYECDNTCTFSEGKKYPSISFEGAFCINYFFTPNYAPDNGITLYYWNAADYDAASTLTTANASGSLKLNGSGTGEYSGDIEGIAAKALSEAVYVAAVYTNGGTTWTSGVLGYSIGAYCASQSTKGGTIAELAKATAVYGYHAKQYFG